MNKKTNSSKGGDSPAQMIQRPRRVILLALDWSRDKDPRTPLGHMSVLASLKAAKLDVVSIVEPVETCNLDDLCIRICSCCHVDKIVDLAIGVYCWNDRWVKHLLPEIRRRGFKGRIILGGPQISFLDDGFKAIYPTADIFICGAGEEALVRVLQGTGHIDFPGVHYGDRPNISGQAMCDLEELPSPWLQHDWQNEPLAHVSWETVRGCPYSCNFCQHRGKKPSVRKFSFERLRQEVDLFCRHGVSSIAILDPVFNLEPDWALKILRAFEECKYTGEISLQCRAELITDEFLEVARRFKIKLEFGLQTIHKSEALDINRDNNIQKVEEALRKTRLRGINHEISIIFGLPNQTLNSFEETVEWCLSMKVPAIKAFPLMLLKGTDLAHNADMWNMQESDAVIPWVESSNTITKDDWIIMNDISFCLHKTEGTHPKTLSDLLRDWSGHTDTERWSPSVLNSVPLAFPSTTSMRSR